MGKPILEANQIPTTIDSKQNNLVFLDELFFYRLIQSLSFLVLHPANSLASLHNNKVEWQNMVSFFLKALYPKPHNNNHQTLIFRVI